MQLHAVGIIFSDICEFTLADQTRIRGCFALKKETRQILSLMFDYRMKADLVVKMIQRIDIVDPESNLAYGPRETVWSRTHHSSAFRTRICRINVLSWDSNG
jgi:hypothetical protein